MASQWVVLLSLLGILLLCVAGEVLLLLSGVFAAPRAPGRAAPGGDGSTAAAQGCSHTMSLAGPLARAAFFLE